jgi:TonB family protein
MAAVSAGGMVILLGVGWLAFTRDVRVTVQSGPAAAVAVEPPGRERDPADNPLEASALADAGGSLPVLVAGAPPQSPDPGMALKPTVVCRLLVDRQGGVAHAKVFQHRPDFARFEDVALSAVKQYRFQPARRSGQAVPVWINWSVDFI